MNVIEPDWPAPAPVRAISMNWEPVASTRVRFALLELVLAANAICPLALTGVSVLSNKKIWPPGMVSPVLAILTRLVPS